MAAQNGPPTDVHAKSKELLLGLKMLLKKYCPAAFRIGVLVRDCNWAGRDSDSGKNALAVLEPCLLVMLSLAGDQWENVEYVKTLVAQTLPGRKNLRFSPREKCVMRHGPNMRKLILGVAVASLPIVKWKPSSLRVVEAVVLCSLHDLCFPGIFAATPPRSFLFHRLPQIY